MDNSANAINWFEIPVNDMARAKKFYETVFSIQLQETEMDNMPMAFFPSGAEDGKVGGALVQGPMYHPTKDGAKLYLNGNPDLQQPLDRAEAAGAKILLKKEAVGQDMGYIAFFTDTEGNTIGLHSNK